MRPSIEKKANSNSLLIGLSLTLILFLLLPAFLSEGWISLVNEMLILALAACGLNLMLGYAGMVSFGPAGFYAVGAYTTALILINTPLPYALAFAAGPVIAALSAIIIGWFCVRLTQVYFALLTLAFAQIIHTIIFEWYSFTKGDNGIVDIPIPSLLRSITHYYYFSFFVIVLCLVLLRLIIKSPFGKILQAMRENAQRAESIGINVRLYQLSTFVLSSFFLGVAGSLFCGFNKNVFPNYAHWGKSTEMLVVCLLGGIYNFFGPIVGSIVYLFLDKVITAYTQYWPLVLGLIIIILLLFLRGGIAGFIGERFALRQRQEERAD
jgi:branched-chain amino acid transport system permease protein